MKVTYTSDYSTKRNDPSFYAGNGRSLVAIVERDEKELHIYATGEMRIELPDDTSIYTADDLYDNDIDTDEKLFKLSEKYSDNDIWINNNWLEVLDLTNEEWLDNPYHSVSEAVNACMQLLETGE